jgi:hypothetical protein
MIEVEVGQLDGGPNAALATASRGGGCGVMTVSARNIDATLVPPAALANGKTAESVTQSGERGLGSLA